MGSVTLRRKNLISGRQSLYLDYYPQTELEKNHNRETLALAEFERSTRQLDIQNRRFNFLSDEKRNGNFVDFFEEMKKKRSGTNSFNWKMSVEYFKDFAGDKVPLSSLNETFCEEYSAYLLTSPSVGRTNRKIKTNTAVSYFAKFKTTLKQAYKKGSKSFILCSLNQKFQPVNCIIFFHFQIVFFSILKIIII
ncbi:phage integrase SAM-like domain-containing protein [Pedobacter alluvionis]|uniref:Integrase-like protein n=1 Tax=Pedobacter alluvionis TaxID=475253 RepID=A0A497XMM8_9SPHI|nr:phage integrase SAM-like domain-containing protein [Pedobacter alluvionis]RLJ69323.1 integrase-like protein [Pedobacter alluvionis]TFB30303.1 hypothetical protein E3V97_19240 [Pedobacter alluvionis]